MRIRTIVAATVIAAGATLSLAGVASASTPTHGGGGHATACAVATRSVDATRIIITKRVHLADTEPGWLVDDEGRTIAEEGWQVADDGRVLDRKGTVIAQRAYIACGENQVVQVRPGDCPFGIAGTRVVQAVPAGTVGVPARTAERLDVVYAAPRPTEN